MAADLSRGEWVRAFCERLGVAPPTPAEEEALRELAATAAHDSERPAAPLACWAAGKSGRDPGELRELAREINP
jgi:hypothetical protein